MNDAPGSYDRLMEKIADNHDTRITKLEERMLKQEVWRNTILVVFTTLVFVAGASARDLVTFVKHLGL